MDGNFFSLFPRDINKKIYTLTHVKYTPFVKSNNLNPLYYYISDEDVNVIKNNMENDVKLYIPNFLKKFNYISYFTSYKCKIISNNDNRDCIIEREKNVISVNCGKIIGIFELENYVKNVLEII